MKIFAIGALVCLGLAPVFGGDDFSRSFDVRRDGRLLLGEEVNVGASSTLKGPARNPSLYQPNNLMDGDPKTVWAEGEAGPGLGAELVFDIPALGYSSALPRGATYIKIMNGCAISPKLYRENNRVKELAVTLYVGVDLGTDDEYRTEYALKEYKRFELALADSMEFQKFELGVDFDDSKAFWRQARAEFKAQGLAIDLGFEYGRYVFASLAIKSVYKGTKYDDTCLSEIAFE